MQNKFRLLLRGLWLLICAGTWIGTVFYRPTLGSVMVTFGAFFLLTSGFVLLSRRPYFALSATTLTLLFLTLLSKAKEFFWKENSFSPISKSSSIQATPKPFCIIPLPLGLLW